MSSIRHRSTSPTSHLRHKHPFAAYPISSSVNTSPSVSRRNSMSTSHLPITTSTSFPNSRRTSITQDISLFDITKTDEEKQSNTSCLFPFQFTNQPIRRRMEYNNIPVHSNSTSSLMIKGSAVKQLDMSDTSLLHTLDSTSNSPHKLSRPISAVFMKVNGRNVHEGKPPLHNNMNRFIDTHTQQQNHNEFTQWEEKMEESQQHEISQELPILKLKLDNDDLEEKHKSEKSRSRRTSLTSSIHSSNRLHFPHPAEPFAISSRNTNIHSNPFQKAWGQGQGLSSYTASSYDEESHGISSNGSTYTASRANTAGHGYLYDENGVLQYNKPWGFGIDNNAGIPRVKNTIIPDDLHALRTKHTTAVPQFSMLFKKTRSHKKKKKTNKSGEECDSDEEFYGDLDADSLWNRGVEPTTVPFPPKQFIFNEEATLESLPKVEEPVIHIANSQNTIPRSKTRTGSRTRAKSRSSSKQGSRRSSTHAPMADISNKVHEH